MSKQTLNIGTEPDDGTGDPLRTAMDKVNDNFSELYGADVLTATNQTAVLTGSRQLLAGTNISFNDATPGQRTVSAVVPDEATGSYSAQSTGFTTTLNYTISWVRTGRLVNLRFTAGDITGTSNSTSWTITGTNMPASIRPVVATPGIRVTLISGSTSDGGFAGTVTVGTDGTLTFYRNGSATGWNNTSGKGFTPDRCSLTYAID